MSDKRTMSPAESSRAFLFVGITFVAVAIVFLATGQSSGMWISFFTIGIVFFSLSATQRPKSSAETTDDPAKPSDGA